MVFNGHSEEYVDTIDEELFTDIQVMYADGLLGNRGIYDALSPVTAAVFNYFRAANAKPIKTQDVFPWIHEYSVDPSTEQTKEDQINQAFFVFLSQQDGFDKGFFTREK